LKEQNSHQILLLGIINFSPKDKNNPTDIISWVVFIFYVNSQHFFKEYFRS